MHYSFWLVPAEPLKQQPRSIISHLAEEYSAIYFEPHVTIYSTVSNDEEIHVIASNVARTFPAFELTVLKPDYADSYTKSLFIRLVDSGATHRMSETIRHSCARPSNYVLDPHLSLLYKTLPAMALAEISQKLDIPKGNYVFDRLRVIETEIPLTRPEQIRRWRTVYDSPLGLT